MTTRILGDIHGYFDCYKGDVAFVSNSIQVGDFGVGFGFYRDSLYKKFFEANPKHRFIRGNHDNPEVCKDISGWIKDGTVENDIMFVGGAWSIDYAMRTEGIDWWRDEELSIEEMLQILDVYAITKPNTLITHDVCAAAAKPMFIDSGLALHFSDKLLPNRTMQLFDAMFEIHKPKRWFFGHWHHTVNKTINDTEFQCIGANDYIDVEL